MVGGTPKPFACTHEGCTMTFTNEDHLNVHQKKHEMDLDLSLGNKPNVFVADQTPTPTRFLRNCEEVGLFQDLQNVNPFEETFRRAVEMVKTGSLPEPDLNTDDTLHTPHVFPLLAEENLYAAKKCREISISSTKPTENDNNNKNLDINNEAIFDHDDDKEAEEKNDNNEAKTITKDHDYALGVNKNDKIKNKNRAKLKLKQAIKNRKNILRLDMDTNSQELQPIQTIYLTPVSLVDDNFISSLNATVVPANSNLKYTSSQITTKNTVRSIPSKIIKSEKGKTTREDILERNRAAAIRCREKRKKWIDMLQNNYEKICSHNKELQEEVSNLKNEVAQLKTLLLAHKDCSVTKNMTNTDTVPAKLIKVQWGAQTTGLQKNRLVLPKVSPEVPQLKIQVELRRNVEMPENSVIVLNKNYEQT